MSAMEVINLTADGSTSPSHDLTPEEWEFLIKDGILSNPGLARSVNTKPAVKEERFSVPPSAPASPPAQKPPSFHEILDQVLEIFPDVRLDHVRALFQSFDVGGAQSAEFIIGTLAENADYPREEAQNERKRKRSESEESNKRAQSKSRYTAADREPPTDVYVKACIQMLNNEFDQLHQAWLKEILKDNGNFLYPTYSVAAKAAADPEFPKMRRRRVHYHGLLDRDPAVKTALQAELDSAKADFEKAEQKTRVEREAALAAQRLEEAEEAAGDIAECQCCFGDYAFSKLTQCNDGHLFCLDCCRRYSENEVGEGRYKLVCMDSSGCKAGFSIAEINKFCETKTLEALMRLEQADSLRIAGENDPNLVHCPFCDFAAICVSVEIDKIFRCQNPPCMETSCRLCQEKSHIPKTCEEHKKENKLSMRRGVEEAMTEALMRRCGKCNTPYVKESGCNKVPCSRCNTVNCYICRKVITDYSHFNDASRGGKVGQCPLFDQNTDQLHENEVLAAEKATIQKILVENPALAEDDLKIKLSAALEAEENRRRAARVINPVANPIVNPPAYPALNPIINPPPRQQPAGYRGVQAVGNLIGRRRARPVVAQPPVPPPQPPAPAPVPVPMPALPAMPANLPFNQPFNPIPLAFQQARDFLGARIPAQHITHPPVPRQPQPLPRHPPQHQRPHPPPQEAWQFKDMAPDLNAAVQAMMNQHQQQMQRLQAHQQQMQQIQQQQLLLQHQQQFQHNVQPQPLPYRFQPARPPPPQHQAHNQPRRRYGQ